MSVAFLQDIINLANRYSIVLAKRNSSTHGELKNSIASNKPGAGPNQIPVELNRPSEIDASVAKATNNTNLPVSGSNRTSMDSQFNRFPENPMTGTTNNSTSEIPRTTWLPNIFSSICCWLLLNVWNCDIQHFVADNFTTVLHDIWTKTIIMKIKALFGKCVHFFWAEDFETTRIVIEVSSQSRNGFR